MSDNQKSREELSAEIERLKKLIEIEKHREIRKKNSLKKIISKERNHRMIFCTARIEYHLKNALNIRENEFNDLTDNEVREIVDELFTDIRVTNAVRQIFSRRRAKKASPDETTQ